MDQSDDLSSIDGLGRLYRRRVEARDVATAGCVSPDAMLALLQREGPESERLATQPNRRRGGESRRPSRRRNERSRRQRVAG